jgi:hypothetical protein
VHKVCRRRRGKLTLSRFVLTFSLPPAPASALRQPTNPLSPPVPSCCRGTTSFTNVNVITQLLQIFSLFAGPLFSLGWLGAPSSLSTTSVSTVPSLCVSRFLLPLSHLLARTQTMSRFSSSAPAAASTTARTQTTSLLLRLLLLVVLATLFGGVNGQETTLTQEDKCVVSPSSFFPVDDSGRTLILLFCSLTAERSSRRRSSPVHLSPSTLQTLERER